MMKLIILLTASLVAVALVVGLVSSTALASSTAVRSTRHADPEAVVNAFVAAYNVHDVDAGLALVADDSVFTFLPPGPGKSVYTGKAEIRAWLEEAKANNDHVVPGDYQVSGDRMVAFARVTGDGLRQIGVDALEGATEIVVQAGKIKSFTYTLDQQSVEKLQAALAAAQGAGMPRTGARDELSLLATLAVVALSCLMLALGGLAHVRGFGRR